MRLSEFTVAGNLLTLEIGSEIGGARFKAICRDMDQAVSELGHVRLVVVMRHYPSLNSAEDFFDDLRFLRLYGKAIDKVAVVCDRSWKDTWAGMFSLFSGIRMEFFDTTQVKEVTRWMRSD